MGTVRMSPEDKPTISQERVRFTVAAPFPRVLYLRLIPGTIVITALERRQTQSRPVHRRHPPVLPADSLVVC